MRLIYNSRRGIRESSIKALLREQGVGKIYRHSCWIALYYMPLVMAFYLRDVRGRLVIDAEYSVPRIRGLTNLHYRICIAQ